MAPTSGVAWTKGGGVPSSREGSSSVTLDPLDTSESLSRWTDGRGHPAPLCRHNNRGFPGLQPCSVGSVLLRWSPHTLPFLWRGRPLGTVMHRGRAESPRFVIDRRLTGPGQLKRCWGWRTSHAAFSIHGVPCAACPVLRDALAQQRPRGLSGHVIFRRLSEVYLICFRG